MTIARRASKNADPKKIKLFLNDAFNDYLAARVLLLSGLPQQGAILSSTAIEKYLKAILAFRGNESHGHLKASHWRAVKNFSPTLFGQLDLEFLELNKKCFRLRYTDAIPVGFNLVVPTRNFLAELDHTALAVQRRFVPNAEAASYKTEFDLLMERRDDRLWVENHVLLKMDKETFIYGAPQFIYEIRSHEVRGLLEANYSSISRPKTDGFLRPAFAPLEDRPAAYEFAFVPILES